MAAPITEMVLLVSLCGQGGWGQGGSAVSQQPAQGGWLKAAAGVRRQRRRRQECTSGTLRRGSLAQVAIARHGGVGEGACKRRVARACGTPILFP